MTAKFKIIKPEAITGNVFRMINLDWMLIAAGGLGSFNMMTASWGGMGVLWNKEVVFCFIRPGRYTFEFMEKYSYFTVGFFSLDYKKNLEFCGTKSGREINKMKESGLTPKQTERGVVYFEEARLVLECRKLYFQDLDSKNFLDKMIEANYPHKDYHRLYIGEIISCMTK